MIPAGGSPGETPTRPLRLASLLAPRDGERSRRLAAVGIGAIGQLAGVGLLATSAWLITTASLRPPVLMLTVAIASVRFFALLRGAARYGERLAGHDLALRALARLRVWAFARLEPLVPARWPGTQRGDLLSRFVADIDGVQDLYVRLALPLAVTTVTAAVTVTTAGLLDPASGLVLGAGLFLGLVAGPAASAVLGLRGGGDLAVRRGQRDALVVEMLHEAAEIAVFGAVPALLARLAGTEREVAHQSRRASIAASLGAGVGVALGGLLAAAMILASLPALDAGRITGATVAVLGFLGLAGAEPVSGLAGSFAKVGDALGGARRALALATEGSHAAGAPTSDRPSAMPDGSLPARSTRHPPWPAPSGTSALQILDGGANVPASPRIALDDVVVRYADGRRPALDHLTLHLDAGQHLALVGPSGAGETTVGYLFVGFVQPSHGTVTLDGLDLCRLDPEALHRLVAWAPQDPHVFYTSVAANLRLARPDATENELADLLDRVGLGPWLADLPGGLATTLGERGTTVSGGERQRLGVARALLADRPVLVLDEPTAHLDGANEEQLRRSVLDAATGKTLVWITHRLAGLEAFDRVVSMERGCFANGQATDQQF